MTQLHDPGRVEIEPLARGESIVDFAVLGAAAALTLWLVMAPSVAGAVERGGFWAGYGPLLVVMGGVAAGAFAAVGMRRSRGLLPLAARWLLVGAVVVMMVMLALRVPEVAAAKQKGDQIEAEKRETDAKVASAEEKARNERDARDKAVAEAKRSGKLELERAVKDAEEARKGDEDAREKLRQKYEKDAAEIVRRGREEAAAQIKAGKLEGEEAAQAAEEARKRVEAELAALQKKYEDALNGEDPGNFDPGPVGERGKTQDAINKAILTGLALLFPEVAVVFGALGFSLGDPEIVEVAGEALKVATKSGKFDAKVFATELLKRSPTRDAENVLEDLKKAGQIVAKMESELKELADDAKAELQNAKDTLEKVTRFFDSKEAALATLLTSASPRVIATLVNSFEKLKTSGSETLDPSQFKPFVADAKKAAIQFPEAENNLVAIRKALIDFANEFLNLTTEERRKAFDEAIKATFG
jgi:hypothetical protein